MPVFHFNKDSLNSIHCIYDYYGGSKTALIPGTVPPSGIAAPSSSWLSSLSPSKVHPRTSFLHLRAQLQDPICRLGREPGSSRVAN